MRLLWFAAAASLLGGGAFGQSLLGQSQPGGGQVPAVIAVPEPPPVNAAPPTKITPAPLRAPAPPPGLVETPLPPPALVQQSSVPPNKAGEAAPIPSPQAAVPKPVPTQAVSPAGAAPAPVISTSAAASPATPAPGAASPAALPPNDVPPAPETKWVYGHVAELGVLNKVEGTSGTLTIPVGGQAVSGDLMVSVQACVNRPAGALPNSAAYITLQSTDATATPAAPVYRGWIVKSLPGVSDAENADEAFRVIGCS